MTFSRLLFLWKRFIIDVWWRPENVCNVYRSDGVLKYTNIDLDEFEHHKKVQNARILVSIFWIKSKRRSNIGFSHHLC